MLCYMCKCELEVETQYKSCPKCRRKAKIIQKARYHEKHPEAKSRKKGEKLSLDDKLVIINDYNRRHGTHLTYGKYMAKFGGMFNE